MNAQFETDSSEHEPIIDRATWDRVHEVLASNAKRRGNEARARTPAPLRGLMRCTHCSPAMTPTHTHRRGRLYRYYLGHGPFEFAPGRIRLRQKVEEPGAVEFLADAP